MNIKQLNKIIYKLLEDADYNNSRKPFAVALYAEDDAYDSLMDIDGFDTFEEAKKWFNYQKENIDIDEIEFSRYLEISKKDENDEYYDIVIYDLLNKEYIEGKSLMENLKESVENPDDIFKAITKALSALGVINPIISGIDDVYHIKYDSCGNIFDKNFIQNLIDKFEDELNNYFN